MPASCERERWRERPLRQRERPLTRSESASSVRQRCSRRCMSNVKSAAHLPHFVRCNGRLDWWTHTATGDRAQRRGVPPALSVRCPGGVSRQKRRWKAHRNLSRERMRFSWVLAARQHRACAEVRPVVMLRSAAVPRTHGRTLLTPGGHTRHLPFDLDIQFRQIDRGLGSHAFSSPLWRVGGDAMKRRNA